MSALTNFLTDFGSIIHSGAGGRITHQFAPKPYPRYIRSITVSANRSDTADFSAIGGVTCGLLLVDKSKLNTAAIVGFHDELDLVGKVLWGASLVLPANYAPFHTGDGPFGMLVIPPNEPCCFAIGQCLDVAGASKAYWSQITIDGYTAEIPATAEIYGRDPSKRLGR